MTSSAKPKVLFLHMTLGGQFEFFGAWLAKNGWDVTMAYDGDAPPDENDWMSKVTFRARPADLSDGDFRHILGYSAGNSLGATELFYRMLHDEGYSPDVVISHTGWGVGLCVRDIWPDTVHIAYHEWYYTDRNWSRGRSERPSTLTGIISNRMRNMPIVAEFATADAHWCPTEFQASRFPPQLRPLVQVMSDGVDCDRNCPNPDARIDFDWLDLSTTRNILTYATRGQEPLRGFPQFMHAVERLQKRRQDFHTVVFANETVSYGEQLAEGDSWRLRMMNTVSIDHRRVHFYPLRPREEYQRLLQASSAHVYFSEPFVTSWSLSEALATGCFVVGSNTAPVRELIEDDETGFLVDMQDADDVADAIEWAFDNPDSARRIGMAARQSMQDKHDAPRIFAEKDALLRQMIADRQAALRV